MKTLAGPVGAAVRNAIRTAHDVKALPRLTAEWNQNRYTIPTALNAVADSVVENDVDVFPIESIIEPLRPSKGINKARIGYGSVADAYHTPSMPRFYISSLEDKYQYWVSPQASDGNGNIGNCVPTVLYNEMVQTNKIVVTVENSWASPVNWSIQTTTDNGASWQTASSAPTIGGDGRAILYWNGNSWSSTRAYAPARPTQINGLRVVVTRLGGGLDMNNQPVVTRLRNGVMVNPTGAGSYFSLIEISARLEKDLTEDLISVSDNMDAGESNHVTPMGTITSNDGTVVLWNGDGRYSEENTGELRGLIDANVKMNLEYIYHVNGQQYGVQQFSLFADRWSESNESTTSVQLTDASKFLKEVYPLEGKYEKLTLAQIVYRLCDSVGFTDYNIMNFPTIVDFRIPVFWTDGSKNLWEIFDDLATATQSLIFFDAWGRLNVRPRDSGYDRSRAIDWTLRGERVGNELADIASLEQDGQYSTNTIKVIYKNTEWAGHENGHPKFQTVWSPEDTVTLRSAPLISGGIGPNDNTFKINPGEAAHWPYSGHVQIEGEFIEYEGKLFNYINKRQNAWNPVWIKDEKQYEQMMEDTLPAYRKHSHWTGDFLIKERGVWNSEEVDHIPEAKGWQGKRYNHSSNNAWGTGAHHTWIRGSSIMRLQGGGGMDTMNAYCLLTRGGEYDTPWKHFGTRMRFNGNAIHHRAGIVFNQWGNGDGYYVEFRPTNTIDNKDRDTQDEVNVFAIHAGNWAPIKGGQRKPDLIVADTWFDVDVYFDPNTHRISVWVNGKRVFNEVVPGNARHAPNGKFGMFARGHSNVDFEYIYAISRNARELPDEAGFHDKIRGAYMGDAWLREWVYSVRERTRWVKRKGKKKKIKKNIKFRKNGQFFDEFGPYVHEVREFDVKFDPAPVAHSKLWFTNDWGIVCPVYRADAFGAYFILANASRTNAVASGDDDEVYAITGRTFPQQLLCYGLPLVFGDDEEVVVRNEAQVRARGEIIAEINSPWIQNEGAARAVADWIAAHWANGADQLRARVFGNTLFEIGDVVAIEYPEKNMASATHQYFVTGIETTFENGIVTNLTLQRKN